MIVSIHILFIASDVIILYFDFGCGEARSIFRINLSTNSPLLLLSKRKIESNDVNFDSR